jgi:hypothetical protein
MVTCTKCHKEKKGIKGEHQAIWAIIGAIGLFLLFGPVPSILVILGMGAYFFKTNHSKKFICSECAIKTCPKCGKIFTGRNHCKEDKIVICQVCGAHQPYDTSLTWKQTAFGTLLLPIILISLIAFWLVDPFLLVLLFFAYSYFSAPNCIQCGERIDVAFI